MLHFWISICGMLPTMTANVFVSNRFTQIQAVVTCDNIADLVGNVEPR